MEVLAWLGGKLADKGNEQRSARVMAVGHEGGRDERTF